MTKPTPGGDIDTWGQILNDALDDLQANADSRIPADVIAAKGDLLAGAADNSAVRHPVGTDGRALVADSTAPTGLAWSAIPAPLSGPTTSRPAPTQGARYFDTDTNLTWVGIRVNSVNYWAPQPGTVVFHAVCFSSGTSLPTGAATALPWSEVVDLFDCFTSGAAATTYTPPVPGLYVLSGCGSFSADTTGDYRTVGWYVDGVVVAGGQTNHLHPAIARFPVHPARTLSVRLNGANAVSLRLQHNASGALTLGGGANIPTMTAVYAGP